MPNTRRLMWIGVITITIIIFFFWGWSMKLQIQAFSWQDTPENKLITVGKQNWEEVYNKQPQTTPAQTSTVNVNTIIQQIVSKINESTTTTASTSASNTFTILSTTSTITTTPIIITTTKKYAK